MPRPEMNRPRGVGAPGALDSRKGADVNKDTMKKIRATHTGQLFDGLLDCYVLEDGRRVVSQRGVVRAITGDANGSAPLGQYLRRLPNEYGHLATQTVVEFARPDGGTANGREAVWLVDLLRAYDEADDAGLLHHTQRHLARNARKILRALAGVAMVALIDEATGYQAIREAGALSFAFRALLLDSHDTWDLMWHPGFVDAIVRLHGCRYDGGPQPRWLASTYDKLYGLILGAEVVAELKRRNPEPKFGTNHHQWLTPEAREVVRRNIEVVVALADTSGTKAEFWARVEHRFSQNALQLSLTGVTA